MKHTIRTLLMTASSLCTTVILGCGPSLDEGADARIRVTPARQITFSRVSVGESRTLPFVVTSVGRDELDIRKIEWDGPQSVSLQTEGGALPRELANQASMPVSVVFTPTDSMPAPNGIIKIYSNDPDTPVYELDVIAQQLAPQIHVVPSAEERLIVGQTDAGATTTKSVVVTNVGDLPLIIDKVSLKASNAFQYAVSEETKFPVTLAANSAESLTVLVSFSPQSMGVEEGVLSFVSNDPAHPTYDLPIVANSDTPCLQISPSLLEFSPALSIGTSASRNVQLTSCSEVPLVISDVMKTSGPSVFTHELIDGNKELAKGESATIKVTYAPLAEGNHQAQYVIINNDPLQANAPLSVMGSASANQCPNADVRGRLSAASTWSKTLDAAPLDTIILDGSQSSDKESSELKYYWSVKTAPRDSTSKIVENGSNASFFVDLANDDFNPYYELCLSVEDSSMMMSCNTDCVKVRAVPRETIHVQLVWHTPKDTTLGDNDGTDLDIHFMTLPDGKWGDTGKAELNNGTDVYFQNREPVWPVKQGNEYPSLDRDDKDGEGPENVNLDKPEACRWYAVGVHYYQDYAFGASYATVRIYVDGKMRFEKANIEMLQTGVFKQVAWMLWDGSNGRFYESDFYADKDNDWIGKTPTVPDEVLALAKISSPQCFK